jgi:hypothetical protein
MTISFGDNDLGMICFGLFFLVLIVLVIFAVLSNRKRKQKLQGLVSQLGFTPQAKEDLELSSALSMAYAPTSIQKINNLAGKVFGDERYYIFDITTISQSYGNRNSSSSNVEYNNVAVLSPHLNLPAFMLMQHMSAPGKLGGMIDNLLVSAAMSAGFHELQDVTTAFHLNYMLFVKDDARARLVFTDKVLDRIAMLDGAIARGDGRLLIFNRFNLRNNGKLDEMILAQQVDLARQMCGWLT